VDAAVARPVEVQYAGIAMVTSGLSTLTISLFLGVMLTMVCVGPLYLVPAVFALLEIATGVALMNGSRRHNAVLTSFLGLLCGLVCFNPLALAGDIVAISLLLAPHVRAWTQDDPSGEPEW
jgi:hypothetical protein